MSSNKDKDIVRSESVTFPNNINQVIDGFQEFRNRFEEGMKLIDLRFRQRPLARMQRELMLSELRSIGIIHVAEGVSNHILYQNASFFNPEVSPYLHTTLVPGRKLVSNKETWFFSLNEINFSHDHPDMPWINMLDFGFGKVVQDEGPSRPALYKFVDMTYLEDRILKVEGNGITYEKQFIFDPKSFGSYAHTSEPVDLVEFEQKLREALLNPKTVREGAPRGYIIQED